jgi:hypothetical protein
MIVERWTWKVKMECRDEVIKLAKAAAVQSGLTRPPRRCERTGEMKQG